MFKGGDYRKADPVPEGSSCSPTPMPVFSNWRSELYKKATILATLSALPLPELAKHIEFIHLFSAGSDHLIHTPIYTDTDILLTTSSGIHGPMISEWVILQMLSNAHKQKLLLEWQRQHKWGAHVEMGELRDSVKQRFGVLGYGSIGRQGWIITLQIV